MTFSRKLGIAIVMIIPVFIGGGAIWHVFRSWYLILFWLVFGFVIYRVFISKLSSNE